MRPTIITKTVATLPVAPNLADPVRERTAFSWEQVRTQLAGLPGGGLNIAYEAVDRHAQGARKDHIAFRWLSKTGAERSASYGELAALTNRFANALKSLGIGKGDRLFILAGRIPELYIAALGALKSGAVVSPLFSAFGPEPIQTRINLGEGSVLVTTASLFERKVKNNLAAMPSLKHVLLVGEEQHRTRIPGAHDFDSLMEAASPNFTVAATQPEDMALLHFTSGTTGTPKGAVHVHGAVLTHYATGKYALDLHPEAVWWGAEILGLPIHDNWWQTETGGIMIANTPAMDIKPGSMGKPLPGVEAAIARRGENGEVEILTRPNAEGELALKRGWPSMFRGYLNQEERYRKCFTGEWYFSGDLARRDEDGYFWFVGRADDVIKSAGHLIGPFEVESTLLEHPAVAEAGVIGKPDAVVGEVVKAFVSLKAGFQPGETLRLELLGHARKRLGAAVAPKEIDFLPSLPRTRSGKIMRRLLKARELGLPEGDTSTLEAGT